MRGEKRAFARFVQDRKAEPCRCATGEPGPTVLNERSEFSQMGCNTLPPDDLMSEASLVRWGAILCHQMT